MLVILFGVNPTVAIGTDIAHGAIFKTVGAVQHRRMGNVRAQLAGWMLLGSAPMSLVGVWLANWIQDRYGDGIESVMAQVLGGALLFGCAGLLAKTFIHAKEVGDEAFALTTRDKVAAVLIGFFGGFIVGLTSVGSGVFFGLTLLVRLSACARTRWSAPTSSTRQRCCTWRASATGWPGTSTWSIVGWLLLGSIPGVLIGGHLTLSIPEQPLRLLLAAVLGLAGLKLVDVPGAGIIVVVALAVGATALLVWLGRHSWIRYQRARAPA